MEIGTHKPKPPRSLESSLDIKGSKIVRIGLVSWGTVRLILCRHDVARPGGRTVARCNKKKSQGGKLEHGRAASRVVASSYKIQNNTVVFSMTQMRGERGTGVVD
jgi:hypothetical protein